MCAGAIEMKKTVNSMSQRREKRMPEMQMLTEKDWDYLIILDACRYDYFEKVYEDFLNGKLKKVISPGSHTIEWFKKTFRKHYNDIVYISANPFINSRVEVAGVDSRKRFYKVFDVWDWGWNEDIGTVHPKQINEAAWKARNNYPEKRLIIHYMQPHIPYLSLGNLGQRQMFDRVLENRSSNTLKNKLFEMDELVWWRLVNILGMGKPSKIRKLLGLPSLHPMDAIIRKMGKEDIRQAYEENLRFVLSYVARLVNNLQGKIVITADHGELLGEGNDYDHRPNLRIPFLVEVPWFEVKVHAQ